MKLQRHKLYSLKMSSIALIYVILLLLLSPLTPCVYHLSDSSVPRSQSTCNLQNPPFIKNSCSNIFTPDLIFIFGIGLSQKNFHTIWKQLAVVPVFIKGNSALVTSDRPIYILNTFPKVESVIINMFHTI